MPIIVLRDWKECISVSNFEEQKTCLKWIYGLSGNDHKVVTLAKLSQDSLCQVCDH